jgi:hypothetical protein
MPSDSLSTFLERTRTRWGPLTSQLVASVCADLTALAHSSTEERWLAALHAERPAARELNRNPTHGFVLLAHSEPADLYRSPHDHGRAWVVYALQEGEMEIRTYARVEDARGQVRLVMRDTTRLRPGEARVYLPGDIHDTRCVAGPSILIRFTERDLKYEDQRERRVTRYIERDGVWTTPP